MTDLDPVQAAFLTPDGPAQAAGAWFAAVVDSADLEAAWAIMDWPLRLSLVQSWMIDSEIVGPNRDRLAQDLAQGPGARNWSAFAQWRLHRWRDGTFELFPRGSWGIVTVPEVVGPDLEFVRISSLDQRTVAAGEAIVAQTLLVRLVDGAWLVAGIGRYQPVPGWPPSEQELPTDLTP